MYALNQLDENYDIIVAGAGPAGSMAAWQAARQNVKVLLLEKDREVGTPVRCAEGVAKKDIEELVEHPIPARWVAAEIHRFRIFAPDGTGIYVHVGDTGIVLHRRIFDYDLALMAAEGGATLITDADVFGVLKNSDAVCGVKVRIGGIEKEIRSKIVIAADGVESRVARWAGIDSTVKPKDLETCAQYSLANIEIDSTCCEFYFSREFAPGGYAWMFPKGEKTANVGLGVAGNFTKNKSPDEYLEDFLARHFPEASIVSKTVGAVPVDKTLKEIAAENFMVVGDAAHQVNPISGGGINSGMIAGKLAGDVAAKAIKNGKTDKKSFLPYVRQWHKQVGKSHHRYYRLKEALMKFDDSQFNRIAADFSLLEPSKQTPLSLFKIAFKNSPSFLLDVFKIFSLVGND